VLKPWRASYRTEITSAGRVENPPDFQNRLHSGYILAEQENRLISQNRLDGGWMALPWLMPAAFECPSLLAIRAAIAPLTHGFQIRLQGLIPKVWLAGSA